MIEDQNSCIRMLGAEILMFITTFIIFLVLIINYTFKILSDQVASLCLSSGYALLLPLMSYIFSQARQHNQEGRLQLIFTWMVVMEHIRARADPIFSWRLQKLVEQLVRLLWLSFLACSYSPLEEIWMNLLMLYIFAYFEVKKGDMFNRAKGSYLIGRNPSLIHNYMKRKMDKGDLQTTPMVSCNYIVSGEETHEIILHRNGYHLGKQRSNPECMITIGTVCTHTSTVPEVFTSSNPYWLDDCLSLALAKLLRRRFANLPVDEARSEKALDFVLKGLVDGIPTSRDIQTNGARNPKERVFSIIQEELTMVSQFLHMKVPFDRKILEYNIRELFGFIILPLYGAFMHSITMTSKFEKSQHCFFHIFGHGFEVENILPNFDVLFSALLFYAYVFICSISLLNPNCKRLYNVLEVSRYIKDPALWNTDYNSLAESRSRKVYSFLKLVAVTILSCIKKVLHKERGNNVKEARVHSSVLDLEAETILFCIKDRWSILARLPNCIRKNIPKSPPTVIHSTNSKEAILESLKKSGDRVIKGKRSAEKDDIDSSHTNGETSQKQSGDQVSNGKTSPEKYDMESLLTNGETSLKENCMYVDLDWACRPNASTTEAILVWHIATTLFHHQETSPQQNNYPRQEPTPQQHNDSHQGPTPEQNNDPRKEPTPQQNNDPRQEPATQQNISPFKKEQEVALELSSYGHYLVKYHPELLPDDVVLTEGVYERVINEILAIDQSPGQQPTKKDRCSYALLPTTRFDCSVVRNGVDLANDLMMYAKDGKQVWKMLAEFWAEMMLYIAPSDNVEGHQNILERRELITQIWALLTHAGVITRPKFTEHEDENDKTEIIADHNIGILTRRKITLFRVRGAENV